MVIISTITALLMLNIRVKHIFGKMSEDYVPKMQRALVLQGGGALGAYDTGVFQALYEKINAHRDGRPLFDVVAGISSGAMNAAILVSNAIDKGWDYAATKLNGFWDYVSIELYIQNIPGFNSWWKNLHSADPTAATEEAARTPRIFLEIGKDDFVHNQLSYSQGQYSV